MPESTMVRIDVDFKRALEIANAEMQKLYGEKFSLPKATALMARSKVIIVIPHPGENGSKWGRPPKKLTLAYW